MGSPKETVENFHATYWQMILVLISTSLVWNACHLVPGKILEHINCLCERRSCHLVANDCTCKWKIRKRACLIICSRAGSFDDTILLLHLLSKSVPHQSSCSPATILNMLCGILEWTGHLRKDFSSTQLKTVLLSFHFFKVFLMVLR